MRALTSIPDRTRRARSGRPALHAVDPRDDRAPLALVVVDDRIEGGTRARLLGDLGFRVAVRRGAIEGLDALDRLEPAVVLVGVWARGMDTIGFCRAVAAGHPGFVDRLVACAPAGVDEGTVRLLREAGVAYVIEGPWRRSELPEALLAAGVPAPTRPADRADPFIGRRLDDRFIVKELLGVGATARVYRVEDQQLRDEVALKLLDPESSIPQAADRFRQEILICRDLNHPNIVRTFDFGVADGRLYYTMERLAGDTLDEIQVGRDREPMPLTDALPLVVQALRGLDFAHRRGVVHRDIKPSNLFVVEGTGQLKIIDFGVAKSPAVSLARSVTGTAVGTPSYMPPECLLERWDTGPALDLYGIGVVLYELVAGRLPFRARSLVELLTKIKSTPPPDPRRLNPSLPEWLASLLLWMLSKNPVDRPRSAAEVIGTIVAAS